jgi:hypothetical protein
MDCLPGVDTDLNAPVKKHDCRLHGLAQRPAVLWRCGVNERSCRDLFGARISSCEVVCVAVVRGGREESSLTSQLQQPLKSNCVHPGVPSDSFPSSPPGGGMHCHTQYGIIIGCTPRRLVLAPAGSIFYELQWKPGNSTSTAVPNYTQKKEAAHSRGSTLRIRLHQHLELTVLVCSIR